MVTGHQHHLSRFPLTKNVQSDLCSHNIILCGYGGTNWDHQPFSCSHKVHEIIDLRQYNPTYISGFVSSCCLQVREISAPKVLPFPFLPNRAAGTMPILECIFYHCCHWEIKPIAILSLSKYWKQRRESLGNGLSYLFAPLSHISMLLELRSFSSHIYP